MKYSRHTETNNVDIPRTQGIGKKMELVEIASSMMTTKGLGYWRAVGEALIKEHTVYDG